LGDLERNYFASVRGVGSMPVPHQKFIQVTTLNPGNPISIAPGKPARVEFSIGEAFGGNESDPPIRLRLQFRGAPPAKQVRVTLNERELSDGQAAGDWLEFRLNGRSLRSGKNLLEVACSGEPTQSLSLLDLCVVVGR
jgi:hypothetical protein